MGTQRPGFFDPRSSTCLGRLFVFGLENQEGSLPRLGSHCPLGISSQLSLVSALLWGLGGHLVSMQQSSTTVQRSGLRPAADRPDRPLGMRR
jgi:hypothetical protein